MEERGLRASEVARRGGTTPKALRLWEHAGILPPPKRTRSGARVYGPDVPGLVAFVGAAQRLGLSLAEIGDIVAIRRDGRAPCPHVRTLVREKRGELDRRIAELAATRAELRALERGWRARRGTDGLVCPHIEAVSSATSRAPAAGRRIPPRAAPTRRQLQRRD